MPKQKDRIILDTNLWLSFLITKKYSALDHLLSQSLISLLFSQELIEEFIAVAKRPKFRKYFSPDDFQSLLQSLSRKAIFIEVTTLVEICRDPKDNFLLSLSQDGKATHLLTGDKDLLALRKFGKTIIQTLGDYLSSK